MTGKLMTIGMLAALSCAGLRAESAELRASIPFDFTVGQRIMPAGEYKVTLSNGTVWIRELRGPHNFVMLTTPARESLRPAAFEQNQGVLVFQRYGDERFLSTVWSKTARDGRKLPESAVQKELARRMIPAEATAIAFSKK